MKNWIVGCVCALILATAGCGGPQEPARPSEPPATAPAPAPPPPEPAPAAPVEKPATPADAPPAATAKPTAEAPADTGKTSASKYGPGIYAHFTTTKGNFIVKFFDKDAPKT